MIKKLGKFGIVVLDVRGKGSEKMLFRPLSEGSKKGLTYPIKYHGNNTEILAYAITAILRVFNIDEDEFDKA